MSFYLNCDAIKVYFGERSVLFLVINKTDRFWIANQYTEPSKVYHADFGEVL